MKEVVLGFGQQKSLWSVVQLADEQLRTIHGSPRRMIVRSSGIEIEASRPQFEGEFQSFAVRFRSPQRRSGVAGRVPRSRARWPARSARPTGRSPLLRRASAGQVEKVHEACDALSESFPLPEVWRVHGEEYRDGSLSPEALFRAMIRFKASDIHLYPGATPVFRVDGVMRRVQAFEPLSSEQILSLIEPMAPEKHFREFNDRQQCSFIYHQVGLGYAPRLGLHQGRRPRTARCGSCPRRSPRSRT